MNEPQTLGPHPAVARLQEQNALLREELVHLLTEAHDLVHTVKPNLLALYQTRIGVWELKQFWTQCQAARLRRRLEMIQGALNRGQWPDLQAIDALLEAEFEAWTTKLRLEGQRIAAAECRLRHLLTDEQDHDLKKLYYGLVKKLHPDLNPALTEDQKRFWLRVQDAYEAADLEELRALLILADRSPVPATQANSLDRLTTEQQTLDHQIQRLLQEIESMQHSPPLTLRAQLTDPIWVAQRCGEIRVEIDRFEKRCAALQAQITLLTGGDSDDQRPGQN